MSMRLKTLWLPIILIAAAGCGNDDENLPNSPQLVIDRNAMQFDTEYNSGTYVGRSTYNTLYIRNGGLQTLEITDIAVSGPSEFKLTPPEGWVAGQPLKLETNAKTFIQVTFSPKKAGDFTGKLTVQSNAANTPSLEIPLTAKGINP
ncbi:hypothetical protein DRW03_30470 [Corallococcus sp. H22C18031201]|nr:hypothetical protein [Citreicoccus inhibens]RJS16642.1 hypothetical protein DRW03_30470 [Corallococcus sp. H22C18031201]